MIYSDSSQLLDYYKNEVINKYENQRNKYGGYSINTETKNGKTIITIKIDLSKIKLNEFANDNNILEYVNENKLKPEGAKKLFTNIGAICE